MVTDAPVVCRQVDGSHDVPNPELWRLCVDMCVCDRPRGDGSPTKRQSKDTTISSSVLPEARHLKLRVRAES